MLAGKVSIGIIETQHLLFQKGQFLSGHANAMRFTATFSDSCVYAKTYFSVGGGAISRLDADAPRPNLKLTHPFGSGERLLEIGAGPA